MTELEEASVEVEELAATTNPPEHNKDPNTTATATDFKLFILPLQLFECYI
jgi:hypothetical protein